MFRSLRVLFAAALFAVPFAVTSVATARTCAPLDPSCTADQIVGGDRGIAEDPGGTGSDAADDAGHTGHGAADTVQGAADDPTGTVGDAVNEVVDTGGVEPPVVGGGGGGGGQSDDGRRGGGGEHAADRHGDGRHGAVGNYLPGGVGRRHNVGASGRAWQTTTPAGIETLVDPTTRRSAGSGEGRPPATVGQVAASVIGGLAVMALLLGGVALFLAVQDRLDRSDPKLVPVAIGSDRVRFS